MNPYEHEDFDLRLHGLVEALSRVAASDDEWFPIEPMVSTFATLAAAPCTRVIYVSKWSVYSNGIRPASPRRDISVVGGALLPPRSRARLMRREAEAFGAPIFFLGDLDPYDLTVYLLLCAGGMGEDGHPADERAAVTYLGAGDALIDLCERHALPDWSPLLDRATITMTDFERRHLTLLEGLWPEMESVVGRHAMALLRSGRKLELEGATNPAIYDDAFPTALAKFFYGEAP